MPEAPVAALYRYPVKGFNAEQPSELRVLPHGRIEGDRALAFRFARSGRTYTTPDGHEWWDKAHLLNLMDYPALARLKVAVDPEADTLAISDGASTLVEASLDPAGRGRIAAVVGEYVHATPEGASLRRTGRLPLTLEGDLGVARFQDRVAGYVSLHGRGSLLALSEVLDGNLDEQRFRSNIAVDGIDAWDELAWKRVRIGDAEFRVVKPIVRCVATHANPETGERDLQILTTLTRVFGQEEPTFGVLLLPSGEGGAVHVGDAVTVLR